VVHVKKLLTQIASLISDGSGQGYKRYLSAIHVRKNLAPIDKNVNHLAFCTIQNVIEACYIIINDNTLTF